MTRAILLAVSLVVVLGGWGAVNAIAQAPPQQVDFSLAPGQSVTLGSYTLQYQGLAGSYPSYDLYFGTTLIARFPSTPPPPNRSKYGYQNVSIVTSDIAPDGSTATGTLKVQ
jgi:hypothetical protein